MLTMKAIKGLSFLREDLETEYIFTPEDYTDEHRMIADMAEKFVLNEVVPQLEEMEKGNFDLSVELLHQAGELGLLGVDIPEELGGLSLDKVSSSLIAEKMANGRSFSVTYGGQVGIGSLPIVYFGSEQQKEKYLPSIATGEKIGAYALTEPTSGTDALAAKTTAQLSDCGQFYILNGEKQFITNSAFADLFIVFAKIDREKFTAFIVDSDTEGLTTGAEEKKMGLKGSSTRALILDNVKVPVENVLGGIGKGHVIAFNILNIGRHKISATCLGTSKQAIELSVKYGNERKQFGKPLTSFGLIKQKIADMTVKTYVNESMVYRTANLLDLSLEGIGNESISIGKAIGEFATECSINKVFSSEALDSIIDEAVQIHGGYGYISEYEVETLYRDSRINRIFEGTNEINRILIATNLLRKFQKDPEMVSDSQVSNDQDPFYVEKIHLSTAKQLLRKALESIEGQFKDYNEEQELLAVIADTVTDIYAMDSALLRTEKASLINGLQKESLKVAYTNIFIQETIQKITARFVHILPYMQNESFAEFLSNRVNHVIAVSKVDVIAKKREIVDRLIDEERYVS